jgi:hypothetical protein
MDRDFFPLSIPRESILEVGLVFPTSMLVHRAVALDLERRKNPTKSLVVDGELIPVVAFPTGVLNLARLATRPCGPASRANDVVDILLSRRAFDKIADEHGVPRLSGLVLQGEAQQVTRY